MNSGVPCWGVFNLKGTVLLDLSFVTFDWQSFCLTKHGGENFPGFNGEKMAMSTGSCPLPAWLFMLTANKCGIWLIHGPSISQTPGTTNPNHHIRMTGSYWHVVKCQSVLARPQKWLGIFMDLLDKNKKNNDISASLVLVAKNTTNHVTCDPNRR